MELDDEPKVDNIVGKLDILKLGHHSHGSATCMEFALKTCPKDIIVTHDTLVVEDTETTSGILGYLQNIKGTNVYITGYTTDAVIADYYDVGYTINPFTAMIPAIPYTTQGSWAYVNNRYCLLKIDHLFTTIGFKMITNGIMLIEKV